MQLQLPKDQHMALSRMKEEISARGVSASNIATKQQAVAILTALGVVVTSSDGMDLSKHYERTSRIKR